MNTDQESSTQKIIKNICLVIGIPAMVFPFLGLVSDISFLVGLFRYWGNWGGFIGLIIMETFASGGKQAVAESLREKGTSHYDTQVMGAMLCLLQYGIIWMCIRTFF